MKKLLFVFFAALVTLTACDSGNGGDAPKSLVLTGGTATSQIIYADETQKTDGIKFTAAEDWTATVNAAGTKAGGSNVDWLTLSQYEGGAGDFSLSITLMPNTTGNDRTATIKIVCGDTTITITVEQKGFKKGEEPAPEEPENPDPENPQPDSEMLISKIVVKEKKSDGSYKYLREADFTYDGQKRPVKVVSSKNGSADGRKELTYDYVTNKMTSIFQKGNYSGGVWQYEDKEVLTFSLDSDGDVVSADGKRESKQNGVLKYISEYTNRFTYTEDGYVATLYFHQVNSNADGGDRYEDGPSNSEFVWSAGNMISERESDSKMEYITYECNNMPNNSNLDLNLCISSSDDIDYTSVFSKIGKRSHNRFCKIKFGDNNHDNMIVTYETNHENGSVTKVYASYSEFSYLYEITYIDK